MGTTLNQHSYRQLIQEDIDWLLNTPPSLERGHIIMILEMEKENTFAFCLKDKQGKEAVKEVVKISLQDAVSANAEKR